MDTSNGETADRILARHFSTIGIEDVFLCEPPHPFLKEYLNTGSSETFVSWEIVGNIKLKPEDFCVREILSNDRSIPGVSPEDMETLRVAGIRDVKKLPQQDLASLKTDEPSKPPPHQNEYHVSDRPPMEVIVAYLKSAISQSQEAEGSCEDMVSKFQSDHLKAKESLDGVAQHQEESSGIDEFWIPPQADGDESAKRRIRGEFHRAFAKLFPLLQSDGVVRTKEGKVEHWIRIARDKTYDDLQKYLLCPSDDLLALYRFHKVGPEGSIENTREPANVDAKMNTDVLSHQEGRKTRSNAQLILRLKTDLPKDERRIVHHLISDKSKTFSTHTIPEVPLDQAGDKSTVGIVVTWQRQHGRNKRKRGRGKSSDETNVGFPNILCTLKKRQKEHSSAIQLISRAFRCRQSDIGVAGIKDMQAVTFQFCTIRNASLQKVLNGKRHLEESSITIDNFFGTDWILANGDLEGNRFEIVVRDVQRVQVRSQGDGSVKEVLVPCDVPHFEMLTNRIQTYGFINFFGEQRIGTPGAKEDIGVRPFDIGRALLQKKYSEAIELILTGRSLDNTRESERALSVRRVWKQSGGDVRATIKAFQGSDILPRERAVLKGLNRYGRDKPLEALRCLGRSVRLFWIHSYQSYIWNQVASKRIQLYGCAVIKGDLYIDSTGDVAIIDSETDLKLNFTQVVLPLPGHGVTYPKNKIGVYYKDLLDRDQVAFDKTAPEESTAKGGYRRLVVAPGKVGFQFTTPTDTRLTFELPKGSYATILLRELMLTTAARHIDTSRDETK